MGLYDVLQELLVSNPSASTILSSWTPSYGNPCTGWTGVACVSDVVIGLDLSNDGFVGSLPQTLNLVTSLQSVKLPGSSFNGTLPASWSALTRLTFLTIANSHLTGTLPSAWSTLGALTQLNLGSNYLTGTIPTAWPIGMVNLTRFVASLNPGLCGPFPGSWTSGRVPSAGTLLGSSCLQTAGLLSFLSAVTPATWPSGMTGWSNSSDPCGPEWTGITCSGPTVTALDLGYYGLQGTLPANMNLVSGLQTLSLGGNRSVWFPLSIYR